MSRPEENPACPLCRSPMVGMSTKNGINWQCTRFPACEGFVKSTRKKSSYAPRYPHKRLKK